MRSGPDKGMGFLIDGLTAAYGPQELKIKALLQHWVSVGLLCPQGGKYLGTGHYRTFAREELFILLSLWALHDMGLRVRELLQARAILLAYARTQEKPSCRYLMVAVENEEFVRCPLPDGCSHFSHLAIPVHWEV